MKPTHSRSRLHLAIGLAVIGAPMGGDLKKIPSGVKARRFAVWALKYPKSGHLDRIQIIKGWRQAGHPREKVHNVAVSDNRKIDPKTNKTTPVGTTVNVKNASYTNTIGDAQLSAVWPDPHFDPSPHAVYYVRVLENSDAALVDIRRKGARY